MQEAAEVRHVILIGREVNHGFHAFERGEQIGWIFHFALAEIHARRQVVRLAVRMHARLQRIEHAHLVAAGEQKIHRMRADESGAARYQYTPQDTALHTFCTRRSV